MSAPITPRAGFGSRAAARREGRARGTPNQTAATAEPSAAADETMVRECIEAQRCPFCGRDGLRSLANHTVKAHQIYASDLRDLAGLPPDAPLCSPSLSDTHRQLARDHETTRWLHRPESLAAAAVSREAGYSQEERRRRVEQLAAIRGSALEALRQRSQAEKDDPKLRAARLVARSKAHREFRPGSECPICGAWFCSVAAPGQDYRQKKYCSQTCRREGYRRYRTRALMLRELARAGIPTGHTAEPRNGTPPTTQPQPTASARRTRQRKTRPPAADPRR